MTPQRFCQDASHMKALSHAVATALQTTKSGSNLSYNDRKKWPSRFDGVHKLTQKATEY